MLWPKPDLKLKKYTNMLRLLSIGLLIVLYLSSTTGLRLQFHYCGGELDYVAVIETGEDCCVCHSKAPTTGCCSTETLSLKTPAKHQVQSLQTGFFIQAFALPPSAFNSPVFSPVVGLRNAEVPPHYLALPPPDLVVAYSNFRI